MQLWDEFLEAWPPEKVRSMSLEEYTNLNLDDAFVYWLEFRTRELGSIRGGSAFKFGVFRRANQDSKESKGGRIWGDRYAWLRRYGETLEAAFAGVRSRLNRVIDAAEAGNLAAIDEVDLSRVLKWKVAFLYQDRENPEILALYKKDLLAARYKESFLNAAKVPPSQQHAALIESYSWLGDALDISPRIWLDPREQPGPVQGKSSRRYWLMSLGRQSRRWHAYYESGIASIGYDQHAVGDLGKLRTRQAIRSKTKEYDIHALRAFWDFPHVMEPGDVIFVKRGQHNVLGHGVVQSEYRFDPERTTHKHLRDVRWDSNYAPDGRRVARNLVTKALTDITEDVDQVNELKIAVGLMGSRSPGERGTNSTPAEVDDLAASDRHPFNQILYGPPGTGKTYGTVGHALAAVDGAEVREVTENDKKRYRSLETEGRIAMVTFHQNYAYEDFVEGIRPRLTEPGDWDGDAEAAEASPSSDIGYELKGGIFRRICEAAERERRAAEAEERDPERFVLIIDEINRGNIPKIFGELITLIEDSRRLGESDETRVTLPYSGNEFGVPNNLYVIGTMNTADRSTQQLDTALRRRFTFVEMMPEPDHELVPADVEGVDCREMLRAMNERIAVLMDREHQIGHTYLFKVRDLDDLSDRFRNRIFPLLQEYFYDDWRKIRAVLGGNAFVQERRIGEGYAKDLAREFDLVDEEAVTYERLPEHDPAWEGAGQYRKIYEPAAAD